MKCDLEIKRHWPGSLGNPALRWAIRGHVNGQFVSIPFETPAEAERYARERHWTYRVLE